MDNILATLVDVIRWRIILCIVISAAFSFFLSHQIIWFDGRYGILIVIFSLFFGLFWQGRAELGVSLFAKTEKVSEPISTIGLLLSGAFLFGILYSFLSSFIGALGISIFLIQKYN